MFQGFEAARNVPQEILDVIQTMAPREQDLLLRHVDGLSAFFRGVATPVDTDEDTEGDEQSSDG
ncbi:MAG: hypothetical protein KC431_12875 [Myxococcales bacterium]|nr:hypothetical protein [Myxococcales bacterium]